MKIIGAVQHWHCWMCMVCWVCLMCFMCFIHVLHTCASCALYAHGRIVGLLGLVYKNHVFFFGLAWCSYKLGSYNEKKRIWPLNCGYGNIGLDWSKKDFVSPPFHAVDLVFAVNRLLVHPFMTVRPRNGFVYGALRKVFLAEMLDGRRAKFCS